MAKRQILSVLIAAAMMMPSGFFAEPVSAETTAQPVSVPYADEVGRVPAGTEYTIMVRLSGKYLTADKSNVIQWETKGDASQKWVIQAAGDGYCAILSAEDASLAMTVDGADGTDGNNISLTVYNGSDAQLFRLERTDDAYFIRAKCSPRAVLDVYDISYENGANIDQWDNWGGEGQKFYIKPTDNTFTYLRGDLDLNGQLDARDLTLMKRGVLAGFDSIAGKIADMNGDGGVNIADVNDLQWMLCGEKIGEPIYVPECSIEVEEKPVAYLFAYFLGNKPEQERLSYAISRDGYHFTALNGGKAVWQSSVGTKCLRDPYIFKGEDGLYHLLATDMQSALGWNSNRNLLSAKSTDLVHWFDESLIEIANKYPNMMGCDRAWAPQAIYDPEQKSYMIYFAARVPGIDDRTVMYYAYSKDLMKLDSEPKLLFAPKNGNDAIDSDIIFENGKYYMYYKNETNKRIYLAVSDHAAGPYQEIKQVSEGDLGVEGPNIYKSLSSDDWLMMSDAYGNGYYVMQKTADLENFTTIPRDQYSFDFTPRHGYVIPITGDQMTALLGAFPSDTIQPYNTAVQNVRLMASPDGTLRMPDTVTAEYSDGGTMQIPVTWNAEDLAEIDTAKAGTYRVRGTVQAAEYENPFIEERADPYVVKGEDGYYYFTASYPAYGSVDKGYDRIILRRSKTVAGLKTAEEKTIWKAHGSGIMAKHIWAPEMHRIGDVWYMFFAAGSSSDVWAIRPYVLRCTGDPYNDEWTECGQMQASAGDTDSFTSFSLDMTYFENNGKHYLIWAEIKGDSSLFMAEIDPSAPWKLISKPILLTKPEFDWELVNHRVNEGAAVLKTGNKVYVYFSASGTGSEYCVGKLEADADANLMDTASWKKYSSPALSSANVNGESGPGHNSFVRDENGNLLIVYHARPSAHDTKACGTYASDPLYDPCRHTRIRQVYIGSNGIPNIAMKPEELLSPENREIVAQVTVAYTN